MFIVGEKEVCPPRAAGAGGPLPPGSENTPKARNPPTGLVRERAREGWAQHVTHAAGAKARVESTPGGYWLGGYTKDRMMRRILRYISGHQRKNVVF